MSKIGKRIIEIPAGVKIHMDGDNCVISASNVSKNVFIPHFLECKIENSNLTVNPLRLRDKAMHAMWGTCRALIANTITGLTKGFEKQLEMKGLGYKAEVKGKTLELFLGYSHVKKYDIADGIVIKCPKATQITVSGNDKQKVGQVASDIMTLRKHNRYKDYGIYEIGKWRFVKVRKSK